jgi:PleD family two-component response regulator
LGLQTETGEPKIGIKTGKKMEKTMIKILIADDHPIMRQGLRQILASQI